MRIESQLDLTATARTNIADLLGRLETGDVIKAKVLDITSSEVVLRLFDGSVLKAAITEDLEAKAGQTLTLAVTSKAGGTLFLETVKEFAQSTNISTDILKNMLSALQIKPDAKNVELAAEFMKAGIPVTVVLFDKAAGLMESFKGLDAEKAVFIASKGLQTDQIKLELLTKLLDGDLKLGQQIMELQTALNSISRGIGKSEANASLTRAIFEAVETALASKASSASNTSAQPLQEPQLSQSQQSSQSSQQPAAVNSSITEGQLSLKFSEIVSNPVSAATNGMNTAVDATAAKSGSLGQQEGAAMSQATAAGQRTANTLAASTASESATASNTSAASNPDSPDSLAENTIQAADMNDVADMKDLQTNKGNVLPNDRIFVPNSTDSTSTNSFSKLEDVMKELFVNINSDKLASELDVNKLNKDLSNKLDVLKAAIQISDLSGLPGGEGLLAATVQLDDSVKLMNQLNNNNMLYYQLPVNISGYNTTAELYVMKRRQNKRRIDPHNTVMFVSLDTENLGRIETLLNVNGKNVSVSLRTEKQQINDFVKENIKYVYSGLADCGYKLADIKYALIDLATPPMKQKQLLLKMLNTNHNKVDMRI